MNIILIRAVKSGVNFTNVLQSAFMQADPESIKIHSSCQYLFAILGSLGVKAEH
jgi:hypothetical protein